MENEHDKAIADLDKAIELKFDPSDWAYANRGPVYFSINRYDQAINDLTEAIKLNTRYFCTYKMRALAYSRKAQYGLSKNDKNRANELESLDK